MGVIIIVLSSLNKYVHNKDKFEKTIMPLLLHIDETNSGSSPISERTYKPIKPIRLCHLFSIEQYTLTYKSLFLHKSMLKVPFHSQMCFAFSPICLCLQNDVCAEFDTRKLFLYYYSPAVEFLCLPYI